MNEPIKGIALCGGIRSGKDTVAEYLVKNHGFTRFAFGDGIRETCSTLFPEQMNEGKPRALLQGVGQDMRKYDPNVWVKWLLTEIAGAEYENQLDGWRDARGKDVEWKPFRPVISDLRQPNEYKALREAGYLIVRINASQGVRINRAIESGDIFSLNDFRHETESHYEKFVPDYEITNEGTIDVFQAQIETFAEYLQLRGVG